MITKYFLLELHHIETPPTIIMQLITYYKEFVYETMISKYFLLDKHQIDQAPDNYSDAGVILYTPLHLYRRMKYKLDIFYYVSTM